MDGVDVLPNARVVPMGAGDLWATVGTEDGDAP